MLDIIHGNPLIICPPDDLVQKNPDLYDMSVDLANKYAQREIVTNEDLQLIGDRLWQALGMQNDFEIACRAAGKKILPVAIESTAPNVQDLPWETLHHPEYGFLGKHPGLALTRRIFTGGNRLAQLEKGPLRVLLFTALPEDVNPETGRLNVEQEQERVQEALLPWIRKGQVELKIPDDGRFSTLQELLKNFRPHVLFLSGHGQFINIPHENRAYGVFLFENNAGDKEAVYEDQIATVLTDTGVQAVILSACESGQAASDTLASGLMRSISAHGIPHVIGMRESVIEAAGIQFAQSLCASLAKRERIDFAVQAARIAIQTPLKEIAADERSLGQWCLPILISSRPDLPLIDWGFQAKEMDGVHSVRSMIGGVQLPEHFVGRRAEMRHYKNRLFKGEYHKLLITGPGGQGKTSLAGKLALDLNRDGWRVFAWTAGGNKPWSEFVLEMEQALDGPRRQWLDHTLFSTEHEEERTRLMLDQLMEQFNERVVLFLDNLESIQDPDTQVLTDLSIAAWVKAARAKQNLILIVTSRWKIPDWDDEHLLLAQTSYGDFLQMAQGFCLPAAMLAQRGWLRHVHEALGGNSRGLAFFAAAARNIQNPDEEHAFLELLAKTRVELQANMAIAEIYRRLPANAQKLVQRLPVYHEPVPLHGFVQLGPDLPGPQHLLERLLDVSLLEASMTRDGNPPEYQCNALVKDWLEQQGLRDNHLVWLTIAAKYHLSLFLERRTLSRAIATHHALRRAQYPAMADKLAMDEIISPLTRAGSYTTLLKDWLPPIYLSPDEPVRARAFAHTGFLLTNIGDFKSALAYLDEALAIQRKIPDRAGEAITLNYIASACQRQGEYEKALAYLGQALVIQQQNKDKRGEAETLGNVAQIHQARGNYSQALEELEIALEIQKQTGDQGQAATLNNISQIFKAWGEYDKALEHLRQASIIQKQIGDKLGESVTLNNIAGIYQRRNDYGIALTYMQQALTIQRQIGDQQGESITLNNMSGLKRRRGEFETAQEDLEKAWEIQKRIGDKAGQGRTLNNIASVYQARGEYETALLNYRQALDMQLNLRDEAGEAQTRNNIGTVLQSQGDYINALEYFEQALVLARKIRAKAIEGTALNNIGINCQMRGHYEEALKYLKEALDLTQQVGEQIGESSTLNNIGTLYEAQGNDQAALEIHNQALAIRRKIGHLEGEAESLSNLSKIYRKQGNYSCALKCLKLACTIQKQTGARPGLCITLLNLGHVQRQIGEREMAADAWLNAYLLAKEMKIMSILRELSKLGPTVGLQEGLDDWEARAPKK
jgi:tetratricopeptide (TPR) repeat protein